MDSAFKYLPGLGSCLMGPSETTLTAEGNELRAVAEPSLTFSDTETGPTVDTSDEKSANGTDENLRNPEFLENKIKDLIERYSREIENNITMKAEVQHYAKRLKEQEEQHQAVLRSKEDEFQKFYNRHKELEEQHQAVLRSKEDEFQKFLNLKRRLENKIEELKNSLKNEKAENQRMESAYKSLEKRFLEEQTKCMRLNQSLHLYKSRLSKEESKSEKLEKDLGYYTDSLKNEKAENQRMESAYKSLEKSFSSLRDSYNDELRKNARETEYMETRLSKKDDELRTLHGELRDKTARLASVFEKRLKQDQRRVENTVEFNRPTDVEKDFMDFFDGERMDACDVMESMLYPKEEIDFDLYYPRLACIIFVTAYEQVKEAREAACHLFENVTRQLNYETPRLSQMLCLTRKEGGSSSHFPITINVSVGIKDQEISTDVVDGLMLSLKQTAHLCNLECFENVVKEIVWERWNKYLNEEETPSLPALSQDVLIELSDYIRACIRLTWRMVTQMPPLQLEYKTIKFDKDIHKLTRSQCNTEYSHSEYQPCGQVHNENIACYMWPALLEGGGRIISKGEVLCELEPVCFDFLVI